MSRARAYLPLTLALFCCVPAAAQNRPPSTAAAAVRPVLRPGAAFVASALLPGSAQYLTRDERWVPYLATELYAWASYIDSRRRANRLQQQYRDLAWDVARRISARETRRDSVFEYYEAMTQYSASGAFDADKQTPGIQPEQQTGTFNGTMWELAQELFIPFGSARTPDSPAYQAALQYYISRAIPEQYAWAWGSSSLEQQTFSDLIAQSDAAARSAARNVGIIIANHIVSAVDALVTARLRELGGGALRIEGGAVPTPHGVRLQQGMRIVF